MSKRAFQALSRFTWSPLICFGLAALLMQSKLMEPVVWRTLDWRTSLRVYFQPPPDPRLSVILFEDSTEMNLVSWPPDRAFHGALVELLALAKPKVVAWDVILDAVREGEGDTNMGLGVGAAQSAGTKVITGSVTSVDPVETVPADGNLTQPLSRIEGDMGKLYGENYAIIPFPQLRQTSWYGFVDAPRSADGIIREIPLILRIGTEVYPSLALQTLMAYYNVTVDRVRVKLGEAVFLPTKQGDLRIPISDAGLFLINYRYDHDDVRPDFPTHSYREVLLKLNSRYVERSVTSPAPPDYQGKIVLIGQTVTGKADAGPTPRSSYSPLVLVHANVVDNILKGDFARRVPEWAVMAGMLVFGYFCVWLAAHRSLSMLILVSGFMLVVYSGLVLWSWVWWSISLPWVGPLLGSMSLEFVLIGRRVWAEQKAKQEIKGMFGSYVSPELVEQLVNSGERPRLGGHQTEITAYFSDIQGFSTFSEKLSPDRLVGLMNEYLTVCTDIVQEEGGTLDKYIGDAVVAMFGAPILQREHAYRACVATQRVQAKLGELCEKWRSEGDKWPEIVWRMQTRIGLNSGHCIVGNMGSRTRFNYTMMGDDVNLAARMESGAKNWGVYTMCSEATKLACEEHGGDRVVFRPLGRIVVKGRTRTTPIYEIVGLKESLDPTARECIASFAQGLERFYDRDWNGAKKSFGRSAALEPRSPRIAVGDAINPSLVYLGIIEQYQIDPPAAEWDGVYIMKEK